MKYMENELNKKKKEEKRIKTQSKDSSVITIGRICILRAWLFLTLLQSCTSTTFRKHHFNETY